MRLSTIIAAAIAVALPTAVSAQTLTVNQSATADGVTTFNTISDALAAVAANPGTDPADPRVIQITDSGTYDEVFNITSPVVLEATGPERATLSVLANPNGTPMPGETIGHGGIWINLPETISSGTVILRNLNILPSLTDTTLNRRLRTAIENGNNNLYLELNNCIITANEHGEPLVTDPYTSRIYAVFPGSSGNPEPYDPAIVMFGGHGVVLGRHYTGYAEGDGVELLLQDSVISHLKNDYHPADVEPERWPTGIVMHSPLGFDPNTWDPTITRITRIEGRSGVSYANVHVSASGDLHVEGTEDFPVVFRSSVTYHLRFDGPAFNFRNLNHVNMSDMSKSGILDRGFGPLRFTMNDSIMYSALESLIRVEVGRDDDNNVVHAASGLIQINDSTIVGGRYHDTAGRSHHTIRLEVDTQTDIEFNNSIIGGKKDQSDINVNVLSLAGYNELFSNGSAFITEGPFSLRPVFPYSRGPNAIVPEDIAEQFAPDPEFVLFTTPNYPVEAGFLNVQNEAYRTLNSEGGPLGGGARYVGDAPSSVSDWAIY